MDILTQEFLSTVTGRQLILASLLTLLVGVCGVLVQQLVNGIKASRPLEKGCPLQLAFVLSALFMFFTMSAFQFPLTLQTFGVWGLATGSATIVAIARRSVLKIGRELWAARAVATHASWNPFLRHIGFDECTAQNYMNVARTFGNTPEIISALPPTALYVLAAPKADPEAVAAIVAEVRSGARFSVDDIKQRLRRPPPAPLPDAQPPSTPALPAPPRDTRGPTLPPQPRSVGPTDHAAHALLVAKQVLLRAALDLLTGELAAGTSLPMPPIMISEEHAREAAQLLLRSPAMEGAASMLAWSATID